MKNIKTKTHKKKPEQSSQKKILNALKKEYPDAHCALHFNNPLELLVATQLSAQCTDKRVNLVTSSLFKKYKKVEDYARVSLKELEKDIKSTGFFRNKARHLKECAVQIERDHGGKVPKDFENLTKLAGVGRKTAHVVMGNAFNISSGIVVDTHVRRLSNRMGFVNTDNVYHIERKLESMVPKKYWIQFSHWLIEHGRKICTARKPYCQLCLLTSFCPKKNLPVKNK